MSQFFGPSSRERLGPGYDVLQNFTGIVHDCVKDGLGSVVKIDPDVPVVAGAPSAVGYAAQGALNFVAEPLVLRLQDAALGLDPQEIGEDLAIRLHTLVDEIVNASAALRDQDFDSPEAYVTALKGQLAEKWHPDIDLLAEGDWNDLRALIHRRWDLLAHHSGTMTLVERLVTLRLPMSWLGKGLTMLTGIPADSLMGWGTVIWNKMLSGDFTLALDEVVRSLASRFDVSVLGQNSIARDQDIVLDWIDGDWAVAACSKKARQAGICVGISQLEAEQKWTSIQETDENGLTSPTDLNFILGAPADYETLMMKINGVWVVRACSQQVQDLGIHEGMTLDDAKTLWTRLERVDPNGQIAYPDLQFIHLPTSNQVILDGEGKVASMGSAASHAGITIGMSREQAAEAFDQADFVSGKSEREIQLMQARPAPEYLLARLIETALSAPQIGMDRLCDFLTQETTISNAPVAHLVAFAIRAAFASTWPVRATARFTWRYIVGGPNEREVADKTARTVIDLLQNPLLELLLLHFIQETLDDIQSRLDAVAAKKITYAELLEEGNRDNLFRDGKTANEETLGPPKVKRVADPLVHPHVQHTLDHSIVERDPLFLGSLFLGVVRLVSEVAFSAFEGMGDRLAIRFLSDATHLGIRSAVALVDVTLMVANTETVRYIVQTQLDLIESAAQALSKGQEKQLESRLDAIKPYQVAVSQFLESYNECQSAHIAGRLSFAGLNMAKRFIQESDPESLYGALEIAPNSLDADSLPGLGHQLVMLAGDFAGQFSNIVELSLDKSFKADANLLKALDEDAAWAALTAPTNESVSKEQCAAVNRLAPDTSLSLLFSQDPNQAMPEDCFEQPVLKAAQHVLAKYDTYCEEIARNYSDSVEQELKAARKAFMIKIKERLEDAANSDIYSRLPTQKHIDNIIAWAREYQKDKHPQVRRYFSVWLDEAEEALVDLANTSCKEEDRQRLFTKRIKRVGVSCLQVWQEEKQSQKAFLEALRQLDPAVNKLMSQDKMSPEAIRDFRKTCGEALQRFHNDLRESVEKRQLIIQNGSKWARKIGAMKDNQALQQANYQNLKDSLNARVIALATDQTLQAVSQEKIYQLHWIEKAVGGFFTGLRRGMQAVTGWGGPDTEAKRARVLKDTRYYILSDAKDENAYQQVKPMDQACIRARFKLYDAQPSIDAEEERFRHYQMRDFRWWFNADGLERYGMLIQMGKDANGLARKALSKLMG